MNDRELLELSAKAAGYLNWTPSGTEGLHIETGSRRGSSGFYWNPLIDDGDALRLAVKLGLEIISIYFYANERCQKPTTVRKSGGGKLEDLIVSFPTYAESFEQYDPCAATRRAIVQAAAEIGKEMT